MPVIGNINVITAVAVVGGALYGFDISSLSAIIATDQYLCYFDQSSDGSCQGPKSDVQGAITASMSAGSCVGALCSGIISDTFGRKKALSLASVIWIIGSCIQCASQNICMLIAGRVINGLSIGICSAQVPVYISEIAPPKMRGRLVSGQEWAITWGIAIMFYISYGCSFLDGEAAFRLPWGLQAVPGALLLIGIFFLPESPRWYAHQDNWEKCQEVLALVHGNGDPEHPLVQSQMEEIRAAAAMQAQNHQLTYMDLFKPEMIWRTHIGVFLHIWSQLTGMNVMMYYITYVFKMAGLSGNILLVSSSIEYIINVVMVVPAIIWSDTWGRRRSMVVGAIGMGACFFVCGGLLGGYGTYAGPNGVDNTPAASMLVTGPPSKGIIACSYILVAFFAATWGPVSWTYASELFPLHLRGRAVALCTSANWATNFALSYFVPPAFVNIRWKTYIVFGIFCFTMAIHSYLAFPETAKKTLEEVEAIFAERNALPLIGRKAWNSKGIGEFPDPLDGQESEPKQIVGKNSNEHAADARLVEAGI